LENIFQNQWDESRNKLLEPQDLVYKMASYSCFPAVMLYSFLFPPCGVKHFARLILNLKTIIVLLGLKMRFALLRSFLLSRVISILSIRFFVSYADDSSQTLPYFL